MITIHILQLLLQLQLLNISRGKENQAIKFGPLKNIMWEIFFYKRCAENEVERLVTDPFCFLRKFYEGESPQHLSFNIFLYTMELHNIFDCRWD